VVFITVSNTLAQAQERDTLSAAQRVGLALARLGGGQVVRIHTSHFGGVVGKVVRDSANLLTLDTGAGTRTGVLTSTVDSLWVPHGGHAGTGAVIGAAAGGIALAAVEVGSASRGTDVSRSALAEIGFLVGGAGGVLIGAFIGTAFPKWQLGVL
jgi:hypothetical protein